MFKILSTYNCWKKYIKCNIWRVAVRPSYIWDARFLKVNEYYSRIFLIVKPTRCTNFSNLFLEWKSTCFGQFPCPSSGVFHCTHSNGICHTGLLTACEQDHVELAMGKTGDVGYTVLRLTVCPWALLAVIAKAIFIRNRLRHSLKRTVGYDGHNWILDIRILCLEQVTFAAMHCLCKHLTIMCCHHRRPREADIFHLSSRSWFRASSIIKLNKNQLNAHLF
jgi:hypothetical protein